MNIGIIGTGNIGGALARLLVTAGCKRLVLHDAHHGTAAGKCLDLYQAASIAGEDGRDILATQTLADMRDCDVIVITAGLARKPGMDRAALLKDNAEILSGIGTTLRDTGCTAHIIVVTNPVDVMSWWLQRITGFDPARIIGMAGVLDTGRFRWFLAKALDMAPSSINGMVIGPHNEDMFAPACGITAGGVPVTDAQCLADAVHNTRSAGAQIVQQLERGSAFFAPAQAIMAMIDALVYDRKCVLPCSISMGGAYGHQDVYCGMPAQLGKSGVLKILQPPLTSQETALLATGIAKLRENQQILLRECQHALA